MSLSHARMPSLKEKLEAERIALEQEQATSSDESLEPELKATEKAEIRAKKESKKKITKK